MNNKCETCNLRIECNRHLFIRDIVGCYVKEEEFVFEIILRKSKLLITIYEIGTNYSIGKILGI